MIENKNCPSPSKRPFILKETRQENNEIVKNGLRKKPFAAKRQRKENNLQQNTLGELKVEQIHKINL
jgi:hypothetical protein